MDYVWTFTRRHPGGASRAAAAAGMSLLALCLLWFSADALAERDIRIARDADTIRIDARLRVDVHHHIAWQVLTDYDNLARFVPGLLTSRIVSEPGAPLLLQQTGQSGFLWLTLPIEVVVQIVEIPLEAIRFSAVSGTLKSKSGEWRIEAQGDATLLIYPGQHCSGFLDAALDRDGHDGAGRQEQARGCRQ